MIYNKAYEGKLGLQFDLYLAIPFGQFSEEINKKLEITPRWQAIARQILTRENIESSQWNLVEVRTGIADFKENDKGQVSFYQSYQLSFEREE